DEERLAIMNDAAYGIAQSSLLLANTDRGAEVAATLVTRPRASRALPAILDRLRVLWVRGEDPSREPGCARPLACIPSAPSCETTSTTMPCDGEHEHSPLQRDRGYRQ